MCRGRYLAAGSRRAFDSGISTLRLPRLQKKPLNRFTYLLQFSEVAPVAQLDRASAYEGHGIFSSKNLNSLFGIASGKNHLLILPRFMYPLLYPEFQHREIDCESSELILVFGNMKSYKLRQVMRRLMSYVLFFVSGYAVGQVKVGHVHSTFGETASEKAADKLVFAGSKADASFDYARAVKFYVAAAEKNPDHPKIWDSIGFDYEQLHQYDQALAAYDKAIEHVSHEQYAYKARARIYDTLGRYDAAIAGFRKQLEVNPEDFESHAELARIYKDQRKYDLALAEFQAETRNASPSPSFDLERGEIELGLHNDDAALAAFHSALEHATDPVMAGTVASALADNAVHLDVAEQLATSVVRRAETESSGTSLANITYDSARWTALVAESWDTMGWVRFAQGNIKAAEKYAQAAWTIDNSTATTAYHLGQIYEKEGRRDDAIHAYALSLSCEMPPIDAHQRLMALAGSDNVASLVETAKGELSNRRAIQLPNLRSYVGTAEFWILLSPGAGTSENSVGDVKFISASGKDGKELREYADELRSASLPYSFPPGEETKLLVRGALACTGSESPCTFTAYGLRKTLDSLFEPLRLPKGFHLTVDPN